VASRDLRNVLGSIGLLPGVILGVPVTLTSLHVLRQEWIARFGPWATLPPAAGVATFPARPAAAPVHRQETEIEPEPAANL
jgi:hypothetical protein